MVYPKVDLESFIDIALEVGVSKVELRNDLPGKDILGGMSPKEFTNLCKHRGVETLTINALQKFNLPSQQKGASEELDGLIKLAKEIGCRAIVLCPNNEITDKRDPSEALNDTVAALEAYRVQFENSGIDGFLEPLGFPESSLDSILTAQQAIARVEASCYKMVYDTFHHYLGPDTAETIEGDVDMSKVGIIHASGVARELLSDNLRDEDRGLVERSDVLGNVEQIALLYKCGFQGIVSLEPFSPLLANLERGAFIQILKESLEFMIGVINDNS